MSASPCFVMCGQRACKTLGCIRVYNDACTCSHSYTASGLGCKLVRLDVHDCPQHGIGRAVSRSGSRDDA